MFASIHVCICMGLHNTWYFFNLKILNKKLENSVKGFLHLNVYFCKIYLSKFLYIRQHFTHTEELILFEIMFIFVNFNLETTKYSLW